jgi:DNA ligase-1
MDAKSINKAIPGCIDIFQVALAEDYDEDRIENWTDWFASRKVDGYRTVVKIDAEGKITFLSREGNEFHCLDKLRPAFEILAQSQRNIVIDGEAGIQRPDGTDDFNAVQKEMRRKNHTIERPIYAAFDILPLAEFEAGHWDLKFSERYEALQNHIKAIDLFELRVLKQERLSSVESLNQLIAHKNEQKWEGLILRKDTGYVNDRSFDLMKVKDFKEKEFTILETYNSFQGVVNEGRTEEEEMLAGVIVEHQGERVQVGSGWSLEEKRLYFKRPELLIGKDITVQYFEPTVNKRGTESLRFPTVKEVHVEGKRTT